MEEEERARRERGDGDRPKLRGRSPRETRGEPRLLGKGDLLPTDMDSEGGASSGEALRTRWSHDPRRPTMSSSSSIGNSFNALSASDDMGSHLSDALSARYDIIDIE